MEIKVREIIQDLNWKKKQVEHNTGTCVKLGYTVQAKHFQEIREIYEDAIFKLEFMLDEFVKNKKEK